MFVETENIELKRQYAESVAKEIVAFLNTEGGTVYIGVADDGGVVGVENVDATLRRLADVVQHEILPKAGDLVELGTQYIDRKQVVVIKIRKGGNLYYLRKNGRSVAGCFRRVGTTCQPMTEDEIEALHTHILAGKARIVMMPGLIQHPTFSQLQILFHSRGVRLNDRSFAKSLCLKVLDGKYNRMSDLLCDQCTVSLKVVRFAGKTKASNFIGISEFGNQCLVVGMEQAFEYCDRVLNENRVEIKGGYRTDTRLFDSDAFREVWFNACVHNNWADGTPPAVYFFSDHLEVVSTGGLPANMTKQEFFDGVSRPVNEELAKIFIRLHLSEQTGHGIPLVLESYNEAIFDFMANTIRVSIPFNFEPSRNKGDNVSLPVKEPNAKSVTTNVTENVTENVTGKDAVVLREIKRNPSVTRARLAVVVGVSSRRVQDCLNRLKAAGLICRVGPDKGGHWEVLK